ncbi:MAG: transcription repressor NadR [Coprobacillaceae bacterium]
MTKEERCKAILQTLSISEEAISATTLAKKFGVSRQVIVQDISLLRAKNIPIIAMARGYILNIEKECQRIIEVRHNDKQIEDELTTIVDLGGKIIDVFVKHQSYGTISADLAVKSRHDVQKFLMDMKEGKSSPLKNLTDEHHYHTIAADSEEILDLIEKELSNKGYLIKR